jgi:hypothetical protein
VSDYSYECLNCNEFSVSRGFDVPFVSVTCEICDSFERLVNGAILDQFRAFEESPPDELDWDRLDREEKLMVSEKIVRQDRSIEDFEITDLSDDAPNTPADDEA